MEKLPNIHPGEILEEEFLKPFNITAYRLAKETKMPETRVFEILKHRRCITAETALRPAKFFGTSPDFWLGLQMEYELREGRDHKKEEIDSIPNVETLHSVR